MPYHGAKKTRLGELAPKIKGKPGDVSPKEDDVEDAENAQDSAAF
jgi:hypothetical protein